jgi:DNA polymerase (family 10)
MVTRPLSNAQIARRLQDVARRLADRGENPFKVQAYRRAAQTIRTLSRSIEHQVRVGGNLTQYPGIGPGIAAALREIVFDGDLGQRELPLNAVGL